MICLISPLKNDTTIDFPSADISFLVPFGNKISLAPVLYILSIYEKENKTDKCVALYCEFKMDIVCGIISIRMYCITVTYVTQLSTNDSSQDSSIRTAQHFPQVADIRCSLITEEGRHN